MSDSYPWYGLVQGEQLEQGDVLFECPIIRPTALQENEMNASDLARLLGVHASLGSKILKGERSLTVDHIRELAVRFKVSPRLFLD